MGILSWLVVGGLAGWLAGNVMKGSGFGLVGNIVVGIIGALVGGFLASQLLGIPDAISGFNLTSIVVAVLGSVVLLAAVRVLRGGRLA